MHVTATQNFQKRKEQDQTKKEKVDEDIEIW